MILSGGIIGGSLPSITYLGTGAATTGNPMLINLSFGDEAPRRLLIAGFRTRAGTATACSIGGVTATLAASTSGVSTGDVYMYYANVPTGTSGDVAVTHASSPPSITVSLWAAYGLRSFTPVDTTSYQSTTSGSTVVLDVNVQDKGVGAAFASSSFLSSTAPTAATWTGMTEDYDALDSLISRVTSASQLFSATETPRTVTASGMSGVRYAGVSASWR